VEDNSGGDHAVSYSFEATMIVWIAKGDAESRKGGEHSLVHEQ
jgi:hypothetical protein